MADIGVRGKRLAKKLIGPTFLGVLDYFRDRTLRLSYGGPFNGQYFRCRMVEEIFKVVEPAFVVETGTFRGTTTEYLANLARVPIYTIENERRFYGFSRARFLRFPMVHVHFGDSRAILADLIRKESIPTTVGLFYLDAHWAPDLPLWDEVEIVFRNWSSAVILIDDFQVPDDPGYHFDNYGPGKALTVESLATLQKRFNFGVWFPACRSEDESGSRRGCAVLAQGEAIRAMSEISTLRSWKV